MEGVAHPFPPSQIRNATTQNSTTLSPMMRLMQSPPPLRGQMTTTLSATNNEMMNCLTNSSATPLPGMAPMPLRPESSYYGSWTNYGIAPGQPGRVSAELSQALLSTYTPSHASTPAQDRLHSYKRHLAAKTSIRPTYPPRAYAIVPPGKIGGGPPEVPIRQGLSPIRSKDNERPPIRDNRPAPEDTREETEAICVGIPDIRTPEN